MGEMKPTPGPWFVAAKGKHVVCSINTLYKICADVPPAMDAEPDARLIAEAGTVFHNTGLSPVQLVEMVKELRTALVAMEQEKSDYMTRNNLGDPAKEHTNKMARAALAKCEGVGNDR